MEPIHDAAKQILTEYQDGLAYKRRMGFLTKWPEYERFKAGDQWPVPTKRTKNLPRPVFNIIELIEGHKVASVMNEQIKMVFSTLEDDVPEYDDAADVFTRYSETTWELVKQNELNEEALEDASNRGTCIWHYYWDNSIEGGNTVKYRGEMCGEIIDAINFFPGNPQQRRVQKQPYNIITSREMVNAIKQEAKMNGLSDELISQIKPDKETRDQGYDGAQIELADGDQLTAITKYWREKDGTVWFTRIAAGMVIRKPTNTFMKLYPIAVMPWKRRKKSIFGVGDTEGLIPNQKAINLLMAMQVLNVQMNGWPKLLYKSGSIDPTQVTNEPGVMIMDKTIGQGFGVDYLRPAPMNAQAQMLVDKFKEFTKELAGANDASVGTAPSAQLNATAIMLLQKAAGVPIESIKRRFYQAMEDIGRIWEEFWKVKYNTQRTIKIKDDDQKEFTRTFRGSDYAGIEMNLKIDIGPSSTYSESLMMSSLDNFLAKGYINFPQYLKYVPKNVVPFKDRLLKEIEQQQEQGAIDQILSMLPPELQQIVMQFLSQAAQQPQQPAVPAPTPPSTGMPQPRTPEVQPQGTIPGRS